MTINHHNENVLSSNSYIKKVYEPVCMYPECYLSYLLNDTRLNHRKMKLKTYNSMVKINTQWKQKTLLLTDKLKCSLIQLIWCRRMILQQNLSYNHVIKIGWHTWLTVIFALTDKSDAKQNHPYLKYWQR